MSNTLISPEEAARRLRVRPGYIQELADKGRLTFTADGQLELAEVDRLATLMDKLRQQGIATLVNITARDNNPPGQ